MYCLSYGSGVPGELAGLEWLGEGEGTDADCAAEAEATGARGGFDGDDRAAAATAAAGTVWSVPFAVICVGPRDRDRVAREDIVGGGAAEIRVWCRAQTGEGKARRASTMRSMHNSQHQRAPRHTAARRSSLCPLFPACAQWSLRGLSALRWTLLCAAMTALCLAHAALQLTVRCVLREQACASRPLCSLA